MKLLSRASHAPTGSVSSTFFVYDTDPVGVGLPAKAPVQPLKFYDPAKAFNAALRSPTGNAPSFSTAA